MLVIFFARDVHCLQICLVLYFIFDDDVIRYELPAVQDFVLDIYRYNRPRIIVDSPNYEENRRRQSVKATSKKRV